MTAPSRFLAVLALTVPLPLLAAEPPKGQPAGKPNRLATETSPYLRQHAHNPVNWYPWGSEAFARARKEGKLIFLSIGYSSCHWCHVMERESFSSPAIAKILNDHFVCIKVDREERPDVDEAYMTALQVLGEGGGWPLSMFLTPDGKPIFGGTYWPPHDREIEGEKVPGFESILKKVLDLDREKRKELLAQADKVAELTAQSLDQAVRGSPLIPLNRELVVEAASVFEFDPEHGGFGQKARGYRGTKFPRVPALMLQLRVANRPGFESVARNVTLTLEKMAAGGIYDQLGGGFHRYSTERTWTVPHFEKMLYDNAQLVELYAEAYRRDSRPAYRRTIEETLAFVAREMTSPDGVFYSALDADSEGEEGRFYVWTAKELDELLTGPDAPLFREVYGLQQPNFEGKYFILRQPRPLAEVATAHKLTETELLKKLAPLKEKLLAARSRRERPFLDTKVLTGWNGQMIAAYARAGEVLQEPKYLRAAERAADFLLTKLRGQDGRLSRIYAGRPGEQPRAQGQAFLEDYAFLVHGLLTLHEATKERRWLDEARALTDVMIRWHEDTERGGFFMTPHDGEKLFARGKDYYDGAQPSGNGTAARNLVRLFTATRDEKYRKGAERTLRTFSTILKSNPHAVPVTTEALDRYLEAPAR